MAESVLLSVEEVALLWKVSTTTVRRALYRDEFPNAFKIGRLWKIPKADVEAYPERWRKHRAQRGRQTSAAID